MDQRLRDQETQHEDDMDMLQDEVRNKDIQLQGVQSKYDHEIELAEQKIQSLELAIRETKGQLSDLQE